MSYDTDTLAGYTRRALTTALPTVWSLDYLVPGVVGEIGEVVGKMAKAERDDWSATDLGIELAYELGDVCWMTAVLIEHMRRNGYRADPPRPIHSNTVTQLPELSLIERGATLYTYHSRGAVAMYQDGQGHTNRMRSITWSALRLWATLEGDAYTITGRPLDTILDMNLEKLQARKAEGQISGSGDHR